MSDAPKRLWPLRYKLTGYDRGTEAATSGEWCKVHEAFEIIERERERADVARNEALDEAALQIECLLPEGGSAEPQDKTDRLIDSVRRSDVEAIRALKTPTPTDGGRRRVKMTKFHGQMQAMVTVAVVVEAETHEAAIKRLNDVVVDVDAPTGVECVEWDVEPRNATLFAVDE